MTLQTIYMRYDAQNSKLSASLCIRNQKSFHSLKPHFLFFVEAPQICVAGIVLVFGIEN